MYGHINEYRARSTIPDDVLIAIDQWSRRHLELVKEITDIDPTRAFRMHNIFCNVCGSIMYGITHNSASRIPSTLNLVIQDLNRLLTSLQVRFILYFPLHNHPQFPVALSVILLIVKNSILGNPMIHEDLQSILKNKVFFHIFPSSLLITKIWHSLLIVFPNNLYTIILRMQLADVIARLEDQADLYTPLPSAFRTRRQSREDRLIEKVLRFIIKILIILDSNQNLEDKIKEIIACIAFLDTSA